MTDLDKLEALAKAATPGPWSHEGDSPLVWLDEPPVDPDRFDNIPIAIAKASWGNGDAAYIAAADPTTTLALIERIRRAEARIELALSCYKPNLALSCYKPNLALPLGQARWRNADEFLAAIYEVLSDHESGGSGND